MKAWTLFCLLAATMYGYELVQRRWEAFTAMLGLTVACLLWQQRGARFSALWCVSMWGLWESSQVFVCQAAAAGQTTGPYQGLCDSLTGFPFYSLGLALCCFVAGLILDTRKSS